MKTSTSYENSLTYLESLGNMRTGLLTPSRTSPTHYTKRMKALIKELDLDLSALKFIHITGTSGKGSVSNLIYRSLLSEGKKTGLFTSPFVTSTIEKIAVDGLYIDPDSFVKLTEKLKPAIDAVYLNTPYGCPSYFECITAIGLMYFVETECEYVVLEAGLGGRFDSTNVIEKPIVTVVTNVDLDHTEILGDTIEKIADDKSGIIKKGSVFFTGEKRPQLISLFKNVCKRQKAHFAEIKEWSEDISNQNNILASAILNSLGFSLKKQSASFSETLPSRFETISENPRIIIDGAHNPAKMKSTSQRLKALNPKHTIIILSIAANKDFKETLKNIIPQADEVILTRFCSPFRKCIDPKQLEKVSKKYAKLNTSIQIMLDPISAFKEAQLIAKEKDSIILVTGSFFLAGDIRSLYYPESYILKKRKSR